ncbi:MAG: class I SAM-dependent methyltransferase [Myxococcaceae bacterium]
MSSDFANRLAKNWRHRQRWAARIGVTAFRVYDRDIPEHPLAVDIYDDHAHISEYPRRKAIRSGTETQRATHQAAIVEALGIPSERQHWKTHLPAGVLGGQYERRAHRNERFVVEEQGLRFWVNLEDFLDTGLFLDHRNTRAKVRSEAKAQRFLNLYGYTGSFSVYAGAGGAATTTTVDLSETYLDWARENFVLNKLAGRAHAFVREDAAQFLQRAAASSFDLIVLDPPSFSTSRNMKGDLDIQRDHPKLLVEALRVLSPSGVLYFSTNRFGFEWRAKNLDATVEELTPASIPEDFTRKDSHRCWRIVKQRG